MRVNFLPVALLFLIISCSCFGQQNGQSDAYLTECKIVFDVSFPDVKPSGGKAAYIPVERVVYIKNEMIRVETKMSDGNSDVVIVDCKNKIAHSLSKHAGEKYAVLSTPDDVQRDATKIPYIEVRGMDDFKKIAGYTCQKYNYLINDSNGNKFSCAIYANFKIVLTNPNWYTARFREVDYFMFEYSIKQSGVVVRYSVKSVEPFKESDKIFTIPSAYKPILKEKFDKLHFSSTN